LELSSSLESLEEEAADEEEEDSPFAVLRAGPFDGTGETLPAFPAS
jgi:hypothetical protein